jgi:hypothetical protein
MIISKYFVGGGPYVALIVPSSFYGIDAGLHALSFSLGFNVHKLYLKQIQLFTPAPMP